MPHSMHNREIYPLFLKLLENSISDQELQRLDELFSAHPELVERYCEFGMNYAAVQMKLNNEVDGSEAEAPADSFDSRLWSELVRHEKTAPLVTIQPAETKPDPVQKVVYEKVPSRVNRFSLAAAICCAAALLFLLLFIRFADPAGGREVATLVDALNVRWASADGSLQRGERLRSDQVPLVLQEGLAELHFDNGARIVVEGPAEFQVFAEDQIKLGYGRLYARVPREAIGFMVKTPSAQVVDLGTEFGVDCDLQNNTALHVIKGKTVLIAGDKSNKVSVEVREGIAKRVSAASRTISDISCKTHLFVRQINSAGSVIWRGETEISLADIVGGGNGFGTGRLNYGIAFDTGKLSAEPLFIGDYNAHPKVTRDFFSPVPGMAAIDGIFVPDGGAGSVIVSSQGHTFEGCPDTTSTWCVPIINGATYKSDSDAPFSIDGQLYGTAERPGLFLHSSIGITYDLDAIRGLLPAEKTLSRFVSIAAALDSASFGQPGLVDIWVLVDGQVRFSRINAAAPEVMNIDIPLGGSDRFLSLVVTDGVNDRPSGSRNKDGFDWVLFGTPELVIE